jgi:DNA repair protein RadD
MSEIDLLKRSNFRWCDLFGCDDALMATGFTRLGWHVSSSMVAGMPWVAGKACGTHLLAVGERTVCMAKADDWLNDHESADSAHKTRRWLNEPPTEKQLRYLPEPMRADFGMTRYQASALLSFQFNKSSIQRLVMSPPTTAIGRLLEMRVCYRKAKGYGWFNPASPQRPKRYSDQWVFCSRRCQDAFSC